MARRVTRGLNLLTLTTRKVILGHVLLSQYCTFVCYFFKTNRRALGAILERNALKKSMLYLLPGNENISIWLK